MADDTITLVSTTDSAEDVQAALTNKPVETPAAKTGEGKGEANTDKATPEAPAETPEQVEERESREEASEAGSALAKRRAKIQASIDKDIQRKTAARLDAEAEESRLTELRRQRQALETAPPAAREPEPPAVPEGPLGRAEPQLDAVDAEGNAKYANYEAYLSDHAVWTKEEAILAVRRENELKDQSDRARIERDSTNRAVNERLADYHSKLETFKKTHADFDAAVDDAKDVVQAALVGMGENAMRVIDGYTIFDAQDGPALTYYLLKHPDELKGIAMKPPPQQLVALARLEAEITRPGAKKNGPSVTVTETKAPEPIRPVGSGPTATTVPLDEESYQDYKARRARELRAKQGF